MRQNIQIIKAGAIIDYLQEMWTTKIENNHLYSMQNILFIYLYPVFEIFSAAMWSSEGFMFEMLINFNSVWAPV